MTLNIISISSRLFALTRLNSDDNDVYSIEETSLWVCTLHTGGADENVKKVLDEINAMVK